MFRTPSMQHTPSLRDAGKPLPTISVVCQSSDLIVLSLWAAQVGIGSPDDGAEDTVESL